MWAIVCRKKKSLVWRPKNFLCGPFHHVNITRSPILLLNFFHISRLECDLNARGWSSSNEGGVKTEAYLSLHNQSFNGKAPSHSFFRSDVNLLTARSKVTLRRFTMSQRGSNYNLHKLTKSTPTTERVSCSLTARRHSPAAVPPGSNGCILNVCHLRTISELKHPNGWLHFSLEVRRVRVMIIYLDLFSCTAHSKRVIKVKENYFFSEWEYICLFFQSLFSVLLLECLFQNLQYHFVVWSPFICFVYFNGYSQGENVLITNQMFTDRFYSFLRIKMRKFSNADMNIEASNYHAKEALMRVRVRVSIKTKCRNGLSPSRLFFRCILNC